MQNKLFHARENLDVLIHGIGFNDEICQIINKYKEKLLSRKEFENMATLEINNDPKNLFEKNNINTEKKAFKRYYNAGLLDNIDEDFLNKVQTYWRTNYKKEIDPVLNLAFLNLTNNPDPRVIPSNIMWNQLIPYFNDMNIRIGYSDKNIYDRLINTPNAPKTILKRVRGHYFDHENNELTTGEAFKEMLAHENDMIIKPSDTDNGKGIKKIYYKNNNLYLEDTPIDMKNLEERYGYNFTVQDIIKQHDIMARPHPSSVNTLRMVTLRWKNKIRYLLTFARFGTDNSIKDNAGTGGVCVGITDDGEFLDFAIDEHCNVYTSHPTTNYDFKQYAKIPNFEKYKEFVIQLHKNILHHDFVSWDIAVGVNNEPIFIEANYRGATWLYQMAAQRPLFGNLTEEILEQVSNDLELGIERNVQSNLTKQNKTLKRKVKKLEAKTAKFSKINSEINKLKKENEKLAKELHSIRNSKSWKSTAIFRNIAKKIK